MTDTKRLRELAEAATPGPWECYGSNSNGGKRYAAVKLTRHPTKPHKTLVCDALFQAAANPQAIIALIDELEKAKAQLAEANAVAEFYGKKSHWFDSCIHPDDVELMHTEMNDPGGKRARQYLQKWKVGK